ncbi:MAG: polyprenyl diphosphate synthase [Candidatus ainarchaeum sp.]|nr:polyprenyl diphosphate synthase [Candidatus ainarchaeum sp.]MDD3975921.1 polyprenyl diphosphate synthase [Candidatus ainarchaeum sp.]
MEKNKINSIGFIADGNRRFAKKKIFNLYKGYSKGADKVIENSIYIYNKYPEIKQISYYLLSTENINRNKDEIDYLVKVFDDKFYVKDKFKNYDINIKILGNYNIIPKKLEKKLKEIENKKKNARLTVYLCIGYGGRQEIIDAVNKIISKNIKKVTLENFTKYLYDKNFIDPEIIVRTGNYKRLSGFLTYECIYSELVFLKKLWPEINNKDIDKIIKNFKNIKRNFGK